MNLLEIGKTIRELRKEKGYSQEELAKMAQISRPTLSKLENGLLANISLVTFLHILRILGHDIEIVPFNPFKRDFN